MMLYGDRNKKHKSSTFGNCCITLVLPPMCILSTYSRVLWGTNQKQNKTWESTEYTVKGKRGYNFDSRFIKHRKHTLIIFVTRNKNRLLIIRIPYCCLPFLNHPLTPRKYVPLWSLTFANVERTERSTRNLWQK